MEFPVWNQLTDPLPDNLTDPMSGQDCGEECIAMVLKVYRNVELSAGCIRQSMMLPPDSWGTRASQLQANLWAYRVGTRALHNTVEQDYARIRAAVRDQRPAIILGRWLSPTVLHWMLVKGITPGALIVNDPFGGESRPLWYGDFQARYYGTTVLLKERYPH